MADLELDEDAHEVRRHGALVTLTPIEFKLLRYLMVNAGQVLSKAQIFDHVWDYSFTGDGNVVDNAKTFAVVGIGVVESAADVDRDAILQSIISGQN